MKKKTFASLNDSQYRRNRKEAFFSFSFTFDVANQQHHGNGIKASDDAQHSLVVDIIVCRVHKASVFARVDGH